MIGIALTKVGADAAKKSKARKQLSAERVKIKQETELKGEELLKQQKKEALKAVAVQYVQAQQAAIQAQEIQKEQEKEKNIQIALATGIGLVLVGVIAYKITNK
jgi:hypothetical protein